MTPEQYQRVTDLFDAALRHETSDREAFIVSACHDDPDVAAAVRRMLAQHDAPAFDLDGAAIGVRMDLSAIAGDAIENHATDDNSAMPKVVGPFTIVGALGSGGMSIVYRARQDFPKREVALKVLRRAALSPAARRRFLAEVQTLAKVSHPNIAQIYQAGTFDDGAAGCSGSGTGRPYFAMELVEGLPLTDFAQQRQLTVSQRLRLMIDICRAVQHAHLRGVIHRDLKPGNILVAAQYAGPQVSGPSAPRPMPEVFTAKILDFGIARATDLDVTRATLVAESGQIVGTLPYMSPEQLAADAAGIDLRSDVYALGVVLFELLAGELPHAVSGDLTLTQAVRRLTQSEPRRLGAVDRSLRGELEVIVSTAMERDRERRYQSAEALADDLQAHLDHRPIRARPPGPILRAHKWLRRHPTAAATIGVMTAAGLVIAALLLQQQQQARRAATAELAQLMADSRQDVRAFADDLDESRRREIELADVRNQLLRYCPPDRGRELERREQELLRARNEHEAALHRIIDSLSRAQRLGAPEEEIRRLRARLYLARVREAEASGDRFARSTYLELARQSDPAGDIAREMLERFNLAVRTEPPGAEAHLFRLVEQSEIVADGDPRLVAVPFRAEYRSPNGDQGLSLAGQFALRVVDGRGFLNDDDVILALNDAPIRDSVFVIAAPPERGLQPLDRLISIDGVPVRGMYDAKPPLPGVNAAAVARTQQTYAFERTGHLAGRSMIRVSGESVEALNIRVAGAAQALGEIGGEALAWRRGATTSISVPPGLTFRTTARPLLICDDSRLGPTPIGGEPIERGQYILLLIKDGFEPLRIPLDVHEGGMIISMAATTWTLLPRDASPTPEGFVRAALWENTNPESFWIMERELTLGEYLEFLNDPTIMARIDASPLPILYPRSGSLMECDRERDGERRFIAGSERLPDEPVLAINWYDAMEYVRWRNQRDRASGALPNGMEYDLPTHQQWLAAWGCSGPNQYPWGMHFRAQWTSSNYAHQQPSPEPVMRFPIDESCVGVFDLAGSVSEWLNAWWIEERDQREIAGGSWGHGGGFNYADMFMLYGQNGQTASVTNGTVGFRLVMRSAKS